MSYPESKFNETATWVQRYAESFEKDTDWDSQNCKRNADEIMNKAGFTDPSSGTYRRVYQNSEVVVKFAIGSEGIDENKAEIRNETRISNTEIKDIKGTGTCYGSKYITSIKTYGVGSNRWIVMEKATVTPNNVDHGTAKKIQNALEAEGIYISEIEPVNMGILNGIPVVFDYAGK